MKANIGWLFYKDYHNNLLRHKATVKRKENNREIEIGVTDIKWGFLKEEKKKEQEENAALLKIKTNNITATIFERNPLLDLQKDGIVPDDQVIRLTTTYPGLLIGSGYQHEAHAEGELKLGFYFDHTTGQPIVPGSSVKGVLCSAFKHPDYVVYKLHELSCPGIVVNGNNDEELLKELSKKENLDFVKNLADELFEGKDKNGEAKSIYKRDIFYNAYINASNEENKHFLGTDFITPHKDKDPKKTNMHQFADPIPLMFLKVLPEVEFCFQFNVKEGIISSGMKIKLFKAILEDLGVGAKTNVGYGQFKTEKSKDKDKKGDEIKKGETKSTGNQPDSKSISVTTTKSVNKVETVTHYKFAEVKNNTRYLYGEVLDNKGGNVKVKLFITDKEIKADARYFSSSDFEINEIIRVEISEHDKKNQTFKIKNPSKIK